MFESQLLESQLLESQLLESQLFESHLQESQLQMFKINTTADCSVCSKLLDSFVLPKIVNLTPLSLFFSPLINPFLPDFGDFSLTDYKDTTV
jgi:hypothetical protein